MAIKGSMKKPHAVHIDCYYFIFKSHEKLIVAAMWMEPCDMMLSTRSQTRTVLFAQI